MRSTEASSIDFQALKVTDLKELLRTKGLSVSGKKEELISRLVEVSSSVAVTTAPTSGNATILSKTTTTTARKTTVKVKGAAPTKKVETTRKAASPKKGTKRPASASAAPADVDRPQAKRERECITRGITERIVADSAELLTLNKHPMRMLSWNVNGLRALLRKPESAQLLAKLAADEQPHLIALQETKLQEENVADATRLLKELLPLYTAHWSCSTAKKGYSGTAALILDGPDTPQPLEVTYGIGQEDGDKEGRTITLKYPFGYVVIVYTPNSGDGLKRLDFRTNTWDIKFAEYIHELSERDGSTPVLVCGDLNCAHQDIDFHNPGAKHTLKQAGLTLEERASFATNLLRDGRFLDTFREQNPEVTGVYTYWSVRAGNRAVNRGLRLDYWLCSSNCGRHMPADGEEAKEGNVASTATTTVSIIDSYVLDSATVGVSDHAPVGVDLAVSLGNKA